MRPEQLVSALKEGFGETLRSIILYGSAAAGDHISGHSDYNLLVITHSLGPEELRRAEKCCRAWVKAGNPPPLLFSLQQLGQSADVFPIELLDIQQSHQVLYGDNPIKRVVVDRGHLRLQIEQELKGKLLQLQRAYLATGGDDLAIESLMSQSLSTFLVLFRAALRLYQESVPALKLEALAALSQYVPFEPAVFLRIEAIKEGKKLQPVERDRVFRKYLTNIQTIVQAVDDFIHGAAAPGEDP